MHIQDRPPCRVSAVASLCLAVALGSSSARAQVGIHRELFTGFNRDNNSLAQLTNDARFINGTPTSTTIFTASFKTETSLGDDYGQRLRAYILAPATGNYVFAISSDEVSELYLSTDENPANKRLIAWVDPRSQENNYVTHAGQHSSNIVLQAGQRYYIEVLHREANLADNLSVRWTLPSNATEEPIPGSRFVYEIPPRLTVNLTNVVVEEGRPVTLAPQFANFLSQRHRWQRNGTDLPGATNQALVLPAASLSDNGALFRAFVTNQFGSTNTAEVTLTILRDTNAPAVINVLRGNHTNVFVTYSEPVDAGSALLAQNYHLPGATILGAEFGADARTVILRTSPLPPGPGAMLAISNIFDRASVPNGLAGTEALLLLLAGDFTGEVIGNVAGFGVFAGAEAGADLMTRGANIGGRLDGFSFAWQSVVGDFDYRTRVEALTLADVWTKAGLMARETLAADGRFAATLASPAHAGSFFEHRASVGGLSASSGSYPATVPNAWLRLQRTGNFFRGLASQDGENWTALGSVNLALSNRLYLGLALASHDTNQPVSAQFRDFSPVTGGTIGFVPARTEPLGPSSRRTGLVISEILYHPHEVFLGTNRAELEFVEVFNSNPYFEDISGYRISGDIDYTFPAGTVLKGGQFVLVGRAPADLQAVYGISNALGPFTNNLPNNGGRVRLRNENGFVLLEVNYEASFPWPVAADGAGHSLVLAHPSYGEGFREAWAASDAVGGSPGRLEPFGSEPLRGVVINEFLAHTDAPLVDFIELHNPTSQPIDVGGAYLTDSPATNKFRIPSPRTIPPFGFATFDQAELGFSLSSSGERILLVNSNQTRVIDALGYKDQANGVSSGRFPDGAARFQPLNTRTPGTANAAPPVHDIVINEIMYNPISGHTDDEYVELLNKGAASIDLRGWRFTDGIDFTIPSNTVVVAGGYLVVAKNRTNLWARYATLNAGNTVGDYDGSLANSGERVALARPQFAIDADDTLNPTTNRIFVAVDEVTFGTGGRWGQWSDGDGSSLELIDPRSDNRLAPNWADSDESSKAPWTSIELTGVLDNGADTGNALHVMLLEAGECLVDNIEVFASGGANLVPNSTFEAGTNSWLFRGNHERSSLENEGFNSTRSVRLRASSRGDIGANKAFINLSSSLSAGQTATIRAKVRWLRGWPEVLFRLRGSYLEATDRMIVPSNLGTPGAINSRALPNAGPAITGVTHNPPVPAANEAVVVSASLADPDGVGATLRYRLDPATNLISIAMNDNGTGGDAVAGDGIFSATIPGQPADRIVAFHIDAGEVGGTAVTRFPESLGNNGPSRECVIHFGSPIVTSSFGTYRFWITQRSIDAWSNREILSNERINGTFVYGNRRVIYNAGARFSGSPAHQDQGLPVSPVGTPNHFSFDMPEDDLLLGTDNFNKVHLPGNNHNDDNTLIRETTAYWMAQKLGLPANHKRHVIMFVNGARRGSLMEDTQVPNSDVVESVFPEDPDGGLYKLSVWYEFGAPAPVLAATGLSEAYLNNYTTTGGAKKRARYRWNWQGRAVNGTANDFTNVYHLIDRANTPAGPLFAPTLEAVADMENWMRTFAVEHAVGNWDSFGYRNEQNMFAYKPERGPWSLLIWDMNIIFGGGTRGTPVPTDGDLFEIDGANVAMNTIYNNPQFRRAYLRALNDLARGPLQSSIVNPLMDARYRSFEDSGISVSPPDAIKVWIQQRRAYIQSQLARVDATNFTLVGPTSFTTDSNLIAISGLAPVSARSIEINGVAWPITWTTVTNWTMRVPLSAATNQLSIRALDASGNMLSGGSNGISVNYTGPVADPENQVVINEILFAPARPDADYIELYNTSTNFAFDLSLWRLNGIGYTFPKGALIPPRGFLVLARNRAAFASAYGNSLAVFDQFEGELQSDGETLSLVRPGPTPGSEFAVDRVRYEGGLPWSTNAHRTGSSFQLVDPNQENARAGNWFSSHVPAVFTDAVSNPVRTNDGWRFVSVTGLSGPGVGSQQMRLMIYTDVGSASIDDISIVPGTNAAVGTNYVRNGDFEAVPLLEVPQVTNSWNIGTNYTNTAIVGSPVHGGSGALRIVCSQFANTFPRLIAQQLSPAPLTNAVHTLSFWYFATNSATNLTVRLFNSAALNVTTNINIFITPSNYIPPQLVSPATNSLSPGAANQLVTNLPAFAPLWINEVQAQNLTGIPDNNGEREPWIEIFNTSSNSVSLEGLYLSSSYTNLLQWAFPAGATIGPRQFLVVFCDGEPNETTASEYHTSFRLAANGGSIALARVHTNLAAALNGPAVLDYVNYAGIDGDRSYGSYPDGQPFDRFEFFYVTPRATNDGRSAPLVVFINEWMASNTNALADPADGDNDDWFELYNPGPNAVDLAGYYLTDVLSNPTKYQITTNGAHVIQPQGYLLVWADNETGQNMSGGLPRTDLHVNFQLARAGEGLGLFAPDGSQVDAITFTNQLDDVSEGRFPNGSANIVPMPGSTSPRASNYLQGGNPNDPEFTRAVRSGDNLELSWSTVTGRRYAVDYKDNLNDPAWTPLTTNTASGTGLSFTNTMQNPPQRFFRIREVP